MGSVVKLFLANEFGWLRTSRDFETSFAWLKALATTFQPISVEAVLAGQHLPSHPFLGNLKLNGAWRNESSSSH